MADHTKAPWAVAGPDNEGLWIEGAKGTAVTETYPEDTRLVCSLPLYGQPEIDEKTEADAMLIAASPDLLEACEESLETFTALEAGEKVGDVLETIKLLRSVVARAKGGER